MKLSELFEDIGPAMTDELGMMSDEQIMSYPTKAFQRGERKPEDGENMKKAKRITGRVKMRKKEVNRENEDTPSQSSLGGHGSSFMHR